MGIVRKAITIPFSLLGIVWWTHLISMVFSSFPLLGNEKMQPTKAEMRTVNLETAMVVRSIQHLSWKSGNLPLSVKRLCSWWLAMIIVFFEKGFRI